MSGSITLNGTTSGATTVTSAAVASGTLTLPAATDTLVGRATTDTLTNKTLTSPVINTPTMGGSVITSGTVTASTSGTAITYTGLPSWVKRITFMLSAVSSSGTSSYIIQLGYGATPTWVTSGYTGASQYASSAVLVNSTNAAGIYVAVQPAATSSISSSVSINLLDASTNTWATSFTTADAVPTNFYVEYCAWSVALAGTLTAVRLTTVNGTDTFDAGKVNILYE